jgi:hypothetical protein
VPIVIVTAVPPAGLDVDRLLERVVIAVAEGVHCPVDDVWASFVAATAQHVGRNKAGQCPIVIIRGRARTADQVAGGMTGAANAVSEALAAPLEDVWVQWIDVMSGAVFAGGDVL